jgi:hypothetical protein
MYGQEPAGTGVTPDFREERPSAYSGSVPQIYGELCESVLMRSPVIRSGGQTGADRAALNWALARDRPHAGWCPRGRKAEDGIIPSRFQLRETPRATYSQRTEWNARDSEGTVIFSCAAQLIGGSRKTWEFARALAKPVLHIAREKATIPECARALRRFIREHRIRVLNVAGPRRSEEPGIGRFVRKVLDAAFLPGEMPVKTKRGQVGAKMRRGFAANLKGPRLTPRQNG